MTPLNRTWPSGDRRGHHIIRIPRVDSGVRIPDELLRNIGYIAEVVETSTDSELDPFATAFFALIPSAIGTSYGALVTTRHQFIGYKGRDLCLVVNKHGGGVTRMPLPRLYEENGWFQHPTDKTADVLVLPIYPRPDMDVIGISITDFIEHTELRVGRISTAPKWQVPNVGIGDEVFFPGLFTYAPGTQRNMPLVRYGNIAMLPDEAIQVESGFEEVYLVEARSIGGLSGSPVFVNETVPIRDYVSPPGRMAVVNGLGRPRLLGIMRGHWDIKERDRNLPNPMHDRERGVNMGIAVVVPASKILETLNHPTLQQMRQEEEARRTRVITPVDD